uniref:RING-type domain-containing protein n=1 Tax=viral metagenome TaxID=1070528 RepID=A0A6C0AC03_9ZZZZ
MDCIICLDPINSLNNINFVNCNHKNYHTKCLELWSTKNKKCPICRQQFKDKNDFIEDKKNLLKHKLNKLKEFNNKIQNNNIPYNKIYKEKPAIISELDELD